MSSIGNSIFFSTIINAIARQEAISYIGQTIMSVKLSIRLQLLDFIKDFFSLPDWNTYQQIIRTHHQVSPSPLTCVNMHAEFNVLYFFFYVFCYKDYEFILTNISTQV